jgi:zinc D-Ala-D-Ala dipeptidase
MQNEIDQRLLKPIPTELQEINGWKEIILVENGEPLVPLGPFSNHDHIFTSSVYAGEKNDSPYADQPLEGSLLTVFVRKAVAEKLEVAQSLLPANLKLVVLDAYRPLTVQQAAFDFYFKQLKEKQPSWSEGDLLTETQKYVSIPSTDSTRPSPHNTGGAVDVVLIEIADDITNQLQDIGSRLEKLGENDWPEAYKLEMRKIALLGHSSTQLNFGTPFDWGGEEAALNYLEIEAIKRSLTDEEQIALLNRRLLYNVMTQSGFQPYQYEWWHFNDPLTQMGAKTANIPYALYGGMTLSEENRQHEIMRVNHRLGSIRIRRRVNIPKLGINQPIFSNHSAFSVVQASVRECGDIRNSTWQRSAIIAP